MSDTIKFNWHENEVISERPMNNGDIRLVTLQVKVVCEWADDIIMDYDSETNQVIETKSGYVMRVLPNQIFVYNNEPTIFLSQVLINK